MNAVVLLTLAMLGQVDYDIWYVRAPRHGDGSQPGDRRSRIPEVWSFIRCEPGSDLVLRKPDGTIEVAVDAGENGCVLDPKLSLDGQWIAYSFIDDASPHFQRPAVNGGADLYRINVTTREVVRLTHQEFTPNRAWPFGPDPKSGTIRLGYGVCNTGPQPLPGGRIVFTSTRNAYKPVKGQAGPECTQLFVMDWDGKNVEEIGLMNLGSALHPTLLKDGRIMWSSYESQGHRSETAWALWVSNPDGSKWEPLMSLFAGTNPATNLFHWQAQWSDGDVSVTEYYNGNNGGMGRLLTFPINPNLGPFGAASVFGSPRAADNPPLSTRYEDFYPFQRLGLFNSTPFTGGGDIPEPHGKVSMPAAAPNNTMLLCYTPGPGYDQHIQPNTPFRDIGIYLATSKVIDSPDDLQLIVNDPAYNEIQPVPIVPWAAIYGSDPPIIPETPNDGSHPALPAGSPYTLVGASTFYQRETDAQNNMFGITSNWRTQGSNATLLGADFDSSLIDKVRILAMEPTSNFSYPTAGREFKAVGNERLRVLGEISLRKQNPDGTPLLDPLGDPDTSVLFKMLADTPYTFQLIASDGTALTTSQTWHQGRPGEFNARCIGCHVHSDKIPGLQFSQTVAAQPGYQIADLTQTQPWTREFHRDVEPIFQAKCESCHGGATPAAGLTLDASFDFMNHQNYHNPPASIVFGYAARQSRLITHDHTTPLANPLTAEERLTLIQWIDLGCQTDVPDSQFGNGVLADDNKPVLTIQSPSRKPSGQPSLIRIGADDYQSRPITLSVKASWPVAGRAAGDELADLFTETDHVYTLAIPPVASGELTVTATDAVGNSRTMVRTFASQGGGDPLEELRAEVATLKAQITALQQEGHSQREAITMLEGRIGVLQGKIDEAKQALE